MAETRNTGVRDSTVDAAHPSSDELIDLLRQERSDFLNYKRRTERERAEDRSVATGEVVQRLLPVIDELDRALMHLPSDLEQHPWAQGVVLTRDRVMKALHDLGVQKVGKRGDLFDPDSQEAVYYQSSPDARDARVSEVVRPGYRLGDRLLRPAQVVVMGPPHEVHAETQEDRRHARRKRAA